VAQNIFLGQTAGLDLVPRGQHRAAAVEILQTLAPHLRVDTPVSKLGMADRQLVEISRTPARGGRIIAFDEPTSSLTPQERDGLFQVIRGLRDAGKAIIYISHRMEEIRAIADRFTIMRDGKVVATDAVERYTDAQLDELIAGRELSLAMEGRPTHLETDAKPLIELQDLSTARLRNIDLSVRPGEVVGLAGLVGSGRSAIMRAVFGIDERTGGEIRVAGSTINIREPKDAMRAGIALIPGERPDRLRRSFCDLLPAHQQLLQPPNLIDIMLQSSINAVIAVGITLVIITRGIDPSAGSIVGLSSMVASDVMSHNITLGIFAGLLVGVICGLVNGLLIAKLKAA
jgi:ABC-type sugar transport system ATPase subunit